MTEWTKDRHGYERPSNSTGATIDLLLAENERLRTALTEITNAVFEAGFNAGIMEPWLAAKRALGDIEQEATRD